MGKVMLAGLPGLTHERVGRTESHIAKSRFRFFITRFLWSKDCLFLN